MLPPILDLCTPRRSTDAQGGHQWLHPADPGCDGHQTWRDADFDAMCAEIMKQTGRGLALNQVASLEAEIEDVEDRAADGELLEDIVGVFSGKVEKGDMCQMTSVSAVLQIRLSVHPVIGLRRRHVRYYFTEPRGLDSTLVSLRLASKTPDEPGLREQTRHAQEAQTRGDRWYADLRRMTEP